MIYDYYVYILANKKNGTLYVGVTNDLCRRIVEHKQGDGSKFTKKYTINKLIYYEIFSDPESAIKREKQLKKWNRSWKINLIEKRNPKWEEIDVQ